MFFFWIHYEINIYLIWSQVHNYIDRHFYFWYQVLISDTKFSIYDDKQTKTEWSGRGGMEKIGIARYEVFFTPDWWIPLSPDATDAKKQDTLTFEKFYSCCKTFSLLFDECICLVNYPSWWSVIYIWISVMIIYISASRLQRNIVTAM